MFFCLCGPFFDKGVPCRRPVALFSVFRVGSRLLDHEPHTLIFSNDRNHRLSQSYDHMTRHAGRRIVISLKNFVFSFFRATQLVREDSASPSAPSRFGRSCLPLPALVDVCVANRLSSKGARKTRGPQKQRVNDEGTQDNEPFG